MPTTASQIAIPSSLTDVLGQIGSGQQSAISGAYAKKKQQMLADALPGRATVLAPGSYASERLGTGENLSMGNLRSGLEQVLGNTAYGDWKNERDFRQNYELAKLAGELMRPSTVEQVLSGLGGGAQTGGQFMGLYNSLKKPMTPYTPTSTPNYGYYTSGGSGLNLIG